MSRELAAELPAPLRALLELDPGDPAVAGLTLLLLTLGDDGWPHQAMLSTGEVAPAPDGGLLLAVWPASSSTRNLRARARATVCAVVDGVSYALRIEAHSAGELVTPLGGTLARFSARVAAASADQAPYAELLSGVSFRLTEPATTVARWREVKRALRA